jgi:DNA gyrase subunit A
MGKKGFALKEEDAISKLYVAAAKDYLLVITARGRLYWIKVYDIPEGDLSGRGRPIQQLIPLGSEQICTLISVKEFSPEIDVLLFSRNGYVKKTSLADFSRPRSSGIIAASVDDDDSLLEAVLAPKNSEVILATHFGKAIIFNVDEIREMGRNARGVIAIRLDKNDFLIGADLISPKQRFILTCTQNGYGKKSDLTLYRRQKRGGKGILNIKVSERIGNVVGLVTLEEELTEVVISSEKGSVKKLDTMTLRAQGRATQGVRIINLRAQDKVVAIEKIYRIND